MARVYYGCLLVMGSTSVLSAQLQITEVLFDSLSAEPRWEWIEIRNQGAAEIDLNGYVLDDDDGAIVLGANIHNTSQATTLAAGGVAVLYNSDANADVQIFRDAWQLSGSTQLIGVATPPGLNNSGGDHFGLWPSYTDYLADAVDDGMGTQQIGGFDHTGADLDFSGFAGGGGASTAWNGSGDYQSETNWGASVAGVAAAVTSVKVSVVAPINSGEDTANPGTLPSGPQRIGLMITEIMYNPRSPEPTWEWVEVFNNSSTTLDFANTGYFMDDLAGAALQQPNLTSGTIAPGTVAILYHSSLTPANFTDAWGAVNAIPVDSFSALNNGGDTIALWDNSADYLADRADDDTSRATLAVAYDDDGVVWPVDDGMASIFLADLSADASVGHHWVRS
ncbi:MAG: lamin tail domain-containing protein, partial [Planctomycetota bacterium]